MPPNQNRLQKKVALLETTKKPTESTKRTIKIDFYTHITTLINIKVSIQVSVHMYVLSVCMYVGIGSYYNGVHDPNVSVG